MRDASPRKNGSDSAFVGLLLAALARPAGGWLADRVGGAAITVWVFVVLAVAPLAAALFGYQSFVSVA